MDTSNVAPDTVTIAIADATTTNANDGVDTTLEGIRTDTVTVRFTRATDTDTTSYNWTFD